MTLRSASVAALVLLPVSLPRSFSIQCSEKTKRIDAWPTYHGLFGQALQHSRSSQPFECGYAHAGLGVKAVATVKSAGVGGQEAGIRVLGRPD
jgi:hypothetical protein